MKLRKRWKTRRSWKEKRAKKKSQNPKDKMLFQKTQKSKRKLLRF